ncbi:MAG: CBS domain-containing protein [Sphingomonas oligoaromativorans]|jgi:CBS domain-containing protein|uniref:CBS domain-containing protein n=1 Tax=Sphingomonas oligoaromativorans TaxID=575322 RepID=UPI0014242A65|nr:CBS domain-containing protein [Sphingomonas oligoaromativorans]NIJ34390.1 CBS domain-containing protein [Sphingomonas oligoaromativorans]
MTIAAILQSRNGEVISVDPDMPVSAVVKLLAERRIGAVPVIQGGRVLGIFSERDVIYRLGAEGPATLDRKVGEVMTAPALTVERSARILSALALMTQRRIRHLPVVEDGAMVGFVSIGDLVKQRIDRIEAEAEAMRLYIAGN